MKQQIEPIKFRSLTEPKIELEGFKFEVDAEVAKEYGVSISSLQSRSKDVTVVSARFKAWYLLSTNYDLSLLAIGKLYGRDHTTIMSGIRRYRQFVENQGKKC